jgi:hypothetical protein
MDAFCGGLMSADGIPMVAELGAATILVTEGL